MIIHLNAKPGSGKTRIGQLVARRLGGCILENYTLYGTALAMSASTGAPLRDNLRLIQRRAFDCLLKLPSSSPIVITNACFDGSGWGDECWDAVADLASRRASSLLIAILRRDDLGARRVAGDCGGSRKAAMCGNGHFDDRPLIEHGGDGLLRLDRSGMSNEQCAEIIGDWASAF